MSTITNLNNILDRLSLKLLVVCLRVDFIEESFAFFLDIKSIRKWEELLLIEALIIVFITKSVRTNLGLDFGIKKIILLNTVNNHIFSLKDTMTRNMVVHLSGTKEVFADFVIDVKINSLGEESSDSGVKMIVSLIKKLAKM